MTETTRLGLHLITDSASDKSMLFSVWRAKIAGEGSDSNMNLIDGAVGDIQDAVNSIQSELSGLVVEDTDGLILNIG